MNYDEIQELMNKRGYDLQLRNANKTYLLFYNAILGLNCEVGIDERGAITFELSKMINMIHCTTTKCGSLENDKHFKRFEDKLKKIGECE